MLRRTYYLPEISPFTEKRRRKIIRLFKLPLIEEIKQRIISLFDGSEIKHPEIKADSQFALEILYSNGNSQPERLRITHRYPSMPITPQYEIEVEGQLEERIGEVEKILGLAT